MPAVLSAAQRLVSLTHDVLVAVLEAIGDPDARAGSGLNPSVNVDVTSAAQVVDQLSLFFNSADEGGAGDKYLQAVDDILQALDAIRDLITAVRFAGDATPLEDYLSFLLEVVGLNVVRGQLPLAYYIGRLVGFIQDKGVIQVAHRFSPEPVKKLLGGQKAVDYYGNVFADVPGDQLKVDATLGAAGGALIALTFIKAISRNLGIRVFYGWDSLPNTSSMTPADALFERTLTVALGRGSDVDCSSTSFETCPDCEPDHFFDTALILNFIFATEESGASSKGLFVSAELDKSFEFELRYGTPARVRGKIRVEVPLPLILHFFIGDTIESFSSAQAPRLTVKYETDTETSDGPLVLVGSAKETRVELGRFSLTAEVAPGESTVSYGFKLKAEEGAIVIVPGDGDGFIQKILGGLLTGGELKIAFALGLGGQSGLGFFLEGGAGFRVTLAVGKQLGPVRLDTLILGFAADVADGKLTLKAEVGASLSFHVTGVDVVVDQMGLEWKLKPLGAMGFKPPKGLGISISLGPVSGGGYLFFDADTKTYAGAVHLQFSILAINGVGVVQTYTAPDGSEAYAFVIILGVEFPGGIQLGFGFTLNGIGGIFGQNRGVSAEALQAGIRAGALDGILFPQNPVANAPRIIASLASIFPVQDGQTIFGPMLKLGWGGARSFIEVSLGLIIEFESPHRLILLGKATADFPLPGATSILHLELDCVGIFNPSTGESSFDATLYRSKVGPFAIVGDIVWRSIGGAQPFWILAIGGINPHFVPPQGVLPPMNRIGINLVTGNNPRAFLSGYTAITSNTLQIGGAVDASYSAAGFTLSAHIGADALINTANFSFIIDFDLSVALKRGSHNLASIGLHGTITGPRPFHFDGTATLSLFFFDVNFHVSFTIGSDKPQPLPSLSVKGPLVQALSDPRNWSGNLPDPTLTGVSVSRATLPTTDPATDLIVHPLGELTVRERVAPLDFQIERFSAGTVDGDNKFSIAAPALGGEPLDTSKPVSDLFPVGDFLALSDHEKLSRPSFEPLTSGISLVAVGVRSGEKLDRAVGYKTIIRKKSSKRLLASALYSPSSEKFLAAVRLGAAARAPLRFVGAARFAGPPQKFTLADPTFTIASTANLSAYANLPQALRSGATYAQAAQFLKTLNTGTGARGAFQVVATVEVKT